MTKKKGQVSIELNAILKRADFSNSVKFYNRLKSRGLSCNYPYFRKIILGEITPSARIIQEVAQGLGPDGDNIILAWCIDSLPKHGHLFSRLLKLSIPAGDQATFIDTDGEKESGAGRGKNIRKNTGTLLTEYQLSVIAKSERHYLFFLLTVLARNPMSSDELRPLLNEVRGPFRLESIIEDFTAAKLVLLTESEDILSKASDIVFPGRSSKLEPYFEKLDRWDTDLPQIVKMKLLNRRILLRRVSDSSIDLINQHLELICDLIKMSDDSDPKKNNSVIRLNFNFSEGKWPG